MKSRNINKDALTAASSLTAALISNYFSSTASQISPVIHAERDNLLIYLLFWTLASFS